MTKSLEDDDDDEEAQNDEKKMKTKGLQTTTMQIN